MKNGSIEFVAVMAEKFKCYVEPYAYYDLKKDYEDLGFQVRENAKRILEMSKNKELLKKERSKAKKLRNKIVGCGNTMDSYGDKYLQAPQKNKTENKEKIENNENFNSIGSYDPYGSKSLRERIGNIVETVDKLDAQERELDQKRENTKDIKNVDLLTFENVKKENPKKDNKVDEDIDFLN
jgi:hypothetical protein